MTTEEEEEAEEAQEEEVAQEAVATEEDPEVEVDPEVDQEVHELPPCGHSPRMQVHKLMLNQRTS